MSFSVLIPTLNEEKYVGDILDCLTRQTYKDFEVIVSDAPSTDKTKDVVLSYQGKLDIKYLISSKKGVSHQRNFAAKNAKYSDLMFFDADVHIEDAFLEKIDKRLKEKKDIGMLTCWNIPISDKKIDSFIYWAFNHFYMEPMKDKVPCAVGTFMYVSKEAFDAVKGFDEEVSVAEDFDLAHKIFKAGYKFDLLKDPKVEISVRRLNKEGRITFILKNLANGFLYHVKGVKKMQGKLKYECGKF